MKKFVLIAMILVLGTVAIAHAGVPTYPIRIDPFWPTMVASPATFETWVQAGSNDAYDPQILVVITQECYDGLTDVELDNGLPGTVTILKAAFTPNAVSDNSASVPPTASSNYQVAALKDHLDEGLSIPLSASDTIYWALADAPFGEPLEGDGTHVTFTVDIHSTTVRALIYVMGSSVDDSGDIDMGIPPTPAGFIVPEPATIAAVATSIGAFGLYAYHRKRKP